METGIVTATFHNQSGADVQWRVLGFSGNASSGTLAASGSTKAGQAMGVLLSGWDSYQFFASPPIGKWNLPFRGDTQISVVFATIP